MQHILMNLALALAAGDVVQDTIEALQVRKKVRWLRAALQGQEYKDRIPFAIDSRAKSYGISLLGLIGFTAIFYVIFWLLDISSGTAFAAICVLLLASYISTAYLLDKYHVEIGALTERAKGTS
jgi:hypothetical protein